MSLFLAFVLGDFLLALLVSRMPLAFARYVLIPVGKQVDLPVPPGVAALVFPPREETATYREAPERRFLLASLAGEVRAVRGEQELHFFPSSNWVLARPRGWSTSLVRVDISGVANSLVLKARRLPGELSWAVFVMIALARTHGLRGHVSAPLFVAFFAIGGIAASRRRARDGMTAVVDEIRGRLAIANGDPPPESEPPLPKLSGDEWACACGMVNKMQRTSCRRCWAQRPGRP